MMMMMTTLIRKVDVIYVFFWMPFSRFTCQGVGVLNIRDGGLSGTWLPKAQAEDLGRRAGRRLSKDASQQWAEVGLGDGKSLGTCLRSENL